MPDPTPLPTAVIQPLSLNVKTSGSLLSTIGVWVGVALVVGFGLVYAWDKAGDAREEKINLRNSSLINKDKAEKDKLGTAADAGFAKTKVIIETQYVDRIQEIVKYVETPEAKQNAVACVLNDNFIGVYNSGASSGSQPTESK